MSVGLGFPGRMADAKVLRYTPLYLRAMQWFGRLGYYIYGDAAYPLKPWLMTGYRRTSDSNEELFNHYGSKVCRSAACPMCPKCRALARP